MEIKEINSTSEIANDLASLL
ncbi:GNAT family N-acetyltransferase, partial [Vibrio cholerae]